MAAQLLSAQGHTILLHGRNPSRAAHAHSSCPSALHAFSADLSSISQTKQLAADVNAFVAGRWGPDARLDCMISNAALGYQEQTRGNTENDLSNVFAVNSLAPYILTALIKRPKRFVYISSGLHTSGDGSRSALSDLAWNSKRWNGFQAYSDSKLHNVLLSNAVARKWVHRGCIANAMTPGWVPTKMGGEDTPDDMDAAPTIQVWLAASEEAEHEIAAIGVMVPGRRQQIL